MRGWGYPPGEGPRLIYTRKIIEAYGPKWFLFEKVFSQSCFNNLTAQSNWVPMAVELSWMAEGGGQDWALIGAVFASLQRGKLRDGCNLLHILYALVHRMGFRTHPIGLSMGIKALPVLAVSCYSWC